MSDKKLVTASNAAKELEILEKAVLRFVRSQPLIEEVGFEGDLGRPEPVLELHFDITSATLTGGLLGIKEISFISDTVTF